MADAKIELVPPTGWLQHADETWSYYHAPGVKVVNNWYLWNEKWYYLNEDGIMIEEPITLTPNQDGALQFPGLKE